MAKKDFIDEDPDRDVQEEEGADEEADEEQEPGEPEEPKKKAPKPLDKTPYERELRRYVKRNGGYRKDLPKDQIKRAKELMKVLGRKEPAWDTNILVPGYDKPTVKNMNMGTG